MHGPRVTDDPAALGSEAKRFRGLAKWCGDHLKPRLITLAEDCERREEIARTDESPPPEHGDEPPPAVSRQPEGS